MIYLSANEAAAQWGVDVRMVQKYCSSGRVVGAVKRGRMWLIPAEAAKPDDMRGSMQTDRIKIGPHLLHPLFGISFEPGNAENTLREMKLGEEHGRMAMAWLRLYQGRSDALNELLGSLSGEDAVGNLAMMAIKAVHALAFEEDAAGVWRKISKRHQEVTEEVKGSEEYKILSDLVVAELSLVLLQRDARLYPEWLRKGDFSGVSGSLRMSAYKSYAMLLFLQGRREELNGVLCMLRELYRVTRCVVGEVYVLLIWAINEIVSGNGRRACELIAEAADRAVPDGLVLPFVQLHMLLGGHDTSIIRSRSEGFYRDVQRAQARFKRNWCEIYINIYKGELMSADLTEKEMVVMMLAMMGLTNKSIAECMGVSANTIKYHMTNIMFKLGISSRKQLQMVF